MMHRNKYRKRFFWPVPIFVVAAGLILGAAVKFLWNAILPTLLGTNPISYWQAVGLLALCRILLGNFGGRMRDPKRDWHRHRNFGSADGENSDPNFAGRPWRGKWMNMSDDERLRFRDEIRRRCGKSPGKQ
jgi:hypothetical protein